MPKVSCSDDSSSLFCKEKEAAQAVCARCVHYIPSIFSVLSRCKGFGRGGPVGTKTDYTTGKKNTIYRIAARQYKTEKAEHPYPYTFHVNTDGRCPGYAPLRSRFSKMLRALRLS